MPSGEPYQELWSNGYQYCLHCGLKPCSCIPTPWKKPNPLKRDGLYPPDGVYPKSYPDGVYPRPIETIPDTEVQDIRDILDKARKFRKDGDKMDDRKEYKIGGCKPYCNHKVNYTKTNHQELYEIAIPGKCSKDITECYRTGDILTIKSDNQKDNSVYTSFTFDMNDVVHVEIDCKDRDVYSVFVRNGVLFVTLNIIVPSPLRTDIEVK